MARHDILDWISTRGTLLQWQSIGILRLSSALKGFHYQLEEWAGRVLTSLDAVVHEMTTNTYLFYDTLLPQVHSLTVVHPPNVPEVTNARVKTDKKAAEILAQWLVAGMLKDNWVWIPPDEVRDLRIIIACRDKMVSLLLD